MKPRIASVAAPTSRVSCWPCIKNPPIREALAKAGAVFVGKAITGDVEKEETASDGNKIVLFSGRVRFGVEWVFNGVKRGEVIVIALVDPCLGFGPFFTKGERYLLYAQGSEDQGFYVTHCNRSEPISSASGRVIGPDGSPVNNAAVELISSKRTDLWTDLWNAKFATSDSQGWFKLNGMAPGTYLLGINMTREPEKNHPYPPTWYPKATSRQAAAIIEVKPGQKLSGYDIIISRTLAERTIEGTVFWPDGRPAANADVYLSTLTQPGFGAGKFVYTNDQGLFKVTGYEGTAYYVVARSAPNRDEPPVWNWFFAEPPLVELKGENVTGLRLTLSWSEETLRDFFEKKREQ